MINETKVNVNRMINDTNHNTDGKTVQQQTKQNEMRRK